MQQAGSAEPTPESPALDPTVQPGGLLSRDPTLVVLAFAVWSFLSGISLLVPGNVFLLGPSYRALARLGVPEGSWGAMMVLDALLLVRTTLYDGLVARSAAAAVSGGFWLFFGAQLLVGGAEAEMLSVIGCWEVVAGLALLTATVQWAGRTGGPHDH